MQNSVANTEIELKFEKLEPKNFSILVDYDSEVAIMNRYDYLEWLCGIKEVVSFGGKFGGLSETASPSSALYEQFSDMFRLFYTIL